MPAVLLSPIGMITQLLSDQGVIGSGFKVNTYVGGSVSTPQATYTDSTGTTLNSNPIIIGSNGRYQSVTVWAVPGTLIKMVVQDASNNTIAGLTIDNIPLINDTTAILAQLANPAGGNGVDLVANGVKSYDIVTSVQASAVPSLAAGQTLIIWLEGLTTVGDGLGGPFYWSVSSSATDDLGLTTIKPTAAGGTGRYLRINRLPTQMVVKTADATLASSTTLILDPDLQIALSTGNYTFEAWLTDGPSGTSAGGMKGTFAYSSGVGPGFWAMNGNGTGVTPFSLQNTFPTGSPPGSSVQFESSQNGAGNMVVTGFITPNASGTLQFWWAQSTSNATASRLGLGSWMRVNRVK